MTESIITSEIEETIMRAKLLKCYGTRLPYFRVSREHYRYLAEQIVALREHLRRTQEKGST
jgi:hypothetical protein